ncbi:MAG: copper resistance protein B [Sulfurimonas sp.]|nr:copper resistance protein B [Sulfurimonas sp.]
MKNLLLLSLFVSSLFAGGGGDILRANFLADSFEYQFNDEKTLYWDTSTYIGYDANKIYIYSEGEKAESSGATSENQLVFSRAIAPFWDVQAGIDYDSTPSSDKTWGVIAIQGLAPYFFETRVALLVADDGALGLRIDADYEALITQKLILTPRFTLDAYSQDDISMGYGSGVSNITLGARLRYEIRRE